MCSSGPTRGAGAAGPKTDTQAHGPFCYLCPWTAPNALLWGLNQAFKRAKARGGASFHSLRQFFSTELFRNGVPCPRRTTACRARGTHHDATLYGHGDTDLKAAIATFSMAGCVEAKGV